MTPALLLFASRLAALGAGDTLEFSPSQPATLTIAAKHAGVGSIVIFDDPGELTVQIGDKHHLHFAAARDAAEFITDLMADRVCITVDFLGGRCIGSSHFRLDDYGLTAETLHRSSNGLKGGNIRSERYLWSGPVMNRET